MRLDSDSSSEGKEVLLQWQRDHGGDTETEAVVPRALATRDKAEVVGRVSLPLPEDKERRRKSPAKTSYFPRMRSMASSFDKSPPVETDEESNLEQLASRGTDNDHEATDLPDENARTKPLLSPPRRLDSNAVALPSDIDTSVKTSSSPTMPSTKPKSTKPAAAGPANAATPALIVQANSACAPNPAKKKRVATGRSIGCVENKNISKQTLHSAVTLKGGKSLSTRRNEGRSRSGANIVKRKCSLWSLYQQNREKGSSTGAEEVNRSLMVSTGEDAFVRGICSSLDETRDTGASDDDDDDDDDDSDCLHCGRSKQRKQQRLGRHASKATFRRKFLYHVGLLGYGDVCFK
jgi:hypothetical protein